MAGIEKIKAEIDRRIEISKEQGYTYAQAQLQRVVDFVESLEKEQDVDLDNKTIMEQIRCLGCSPSEYDVARHFYELGCRHTAVMYDDIEFERQRRQEEEKSEIPTIRGWVARDKDAVCPMLFEKKPERRTRRPLCWVVEGGCYSMKLMPYLFPDLKWEDEPIEVELTIHRV